MPTAYGDSRHVGHDSPGPVHGFLGHHNLSYDAKTENIVRGALGVDVGRGFDTSAGKVTPTAGVRWNHDFAKLDGVITSRFAGTTGGSFITANNRRSLSLRC